MTIEGYAFKETGAKLESFAYDPGDLAVDEVEVEYWRAKP